MPKELCWGCKAVKDGVKLCAEDRLCPDCDRENERRLAAIRAGDQSISSGQRMTSQNSSSTSEASRDERIVVNELLSYVSYYRDRANAAAIQRVVLSFYSPAEIAAAKKTLASMFASKLINCPLLVERRNSTSRPAQGAEIEDILGILDILDRADALCSVVYAAVNFDRIPHYGPEEINMCAVVDRQVRADASIEQLTRAVEFLTAERDETVMTPQIAVADKVIEAVSARITTAVDNQLKRLDSFYKNDHRTMENAARPSHQGPSVNTNRPNNDSPDRTLNIVVFGVTEDKNNSVWHATLAAALQHVAGRPVDITDAFRIGKFSTSQLRPRPIIVKLRCVWDKRLILSNTRKLADVTEFRHIGVAPDEPLETRRKNTLKRLHDKALRDGKQALLSDDRSALFVDGNLVFSLKDGLTGNISSTVNSVNNG